VCGRALWLVVLSALGPRTHARRLCTLHDILGRGLRQGRATGGEKGRTADVAPHLASNAPTLQHPTLPPKAIVNSTTEHGWENRALARESRPVGSRPDR